MHKLVEHKLMIENDKTPPIVLNIPEKITLKIGQDFNANQFLKEKNVYAIDEATDNIPITINEEGIDYNKAENYTIIVSAKDEAENETNNEITLIIQDYPVHEAYMEAIDLDISYLNKTATGSYEYDGLHISNDEIDSLEAGTIYRSIAKQLEGFYILGEKFYGNWGTDLVPIVYGFDKPATWEKMQPYVEQALRIFF